MTVTAGRKGPRSSVGLRINQDGRNAIDIVRIRYQITESDIGKTLGLSTRVASNILLGKRVLTKEESLSLYAILQNAPEVEFLNQYANDTGVGFSQFLVPSYQSSNNIAHTITCNTALQPYYRRIDRVYVSSSDEKIGELFMDLEGLIRKYTSQNQQA